MHRDLPERNPEPSRVGALTLFWASAHNLFELLGNFRGFGSLLPVRRELIIPECLTYMPSAEARLTHTSGAPDTRM
jgi:hypothetical protein